jgi:hypothetical protein
MFKKNTWENWEREILSVICNALTELISEKPDDKAEDLLNRRLATLIRKHKLEYELKNDRYIMGSCLYHVPGQPDINDRFKLSRENKIPEFTWEFSDYIKKISRDYHIECKRLCKDVNNYSREYVLSGIVRYLDMKWSYGINCKSGLMIGYIQDLEHSLFFTKINSHCKTHGINSIKVKGSFNKKGISQLQHIFTRSFHHSPFKLRHFWVDLRNK